LLRKLLLTATPLLLLTLIFYPVYAQTVVLTVPPRYAYDAWLELTSGDEIDYSFSVTSWRGADEIGFAITDFSGNTVFFYAGRVSQYSGSFAVPSTGVYALRFDNSFSFITTKYVALTYSVNSAQGYESVTNGFPQTVSVSGPPSFLPQMNLLVLWTAVIAIFLLGIIIAIYGLIMGARRSSLSSHHSSENASVAPPEASAESSHTLQVQKKGPLGYIAAALVAVGVVMLVYSATVGIPEYLSGSLFRDQNGVWSWYLFFAVNPLMATLLQVAPMFILFGVGLMFVASRTSSHQIIPVPIARKKNENQPTTEVKEVVVEPIQSTKKCPYCGAEVTVDRIICGKCQMPT